MMKHMMTMKQILFLISLLLSLSTRVVDKQQKYAWLWYELLALVIFYIYVLWYKKVVVVVYIFKHIGVCDS